MLVEPGFFRTELLTEESTKYPEPSIDDYAEKTKQTVTAWKKMNGLQGGDPAKLAKALVQLASQAEPPLRWPAGADAVETFREEGQGVARPGQRPPGAVLVARARRRCLIAGALERPNAPKTCHAPRRVRPPWPIR